MDILWKSSPAHDSIAPARFSAAGSPARRKRVSLRALALLAALVLLATYARPAHAQGALVDCTPPLNLSNSEDATSADPFMLGDPNGDIHLFWSEMGTPELGANVPNTVMYTRWNGQEWSKPNDILFSPGDPFVQRVNSIRGAMDADGRIHLIWLGGEKTFYYSSSRSIDAGSTQGWTPPYMIANDQTGTQYSADIAASESGVLHLALARDPRRDNRNISYMRSTDGGVTWSEPQPVHIFINPVRGGSNVRIHTAPPANVYMTWTEWDLSGNGQRIYFARSLDDGLTWDKPVVLATREENDYERDWTNLAVLEPDHLVVLWEGGFRAYPQMQYSYNNGQTWTEPVDTFYWLIADNGFGEFVRDSDGQLHVFLSRRLREGYTDRCDYFAGCAGTDTNAIWHSVWQGGNNWSEPLPMGEFDGGNFVTVAMSGGNQVFAAFFDYVFFEVNVQSCRVPNAPAVEPVVWPTSTPRPTVTPTPTLDLPTPTPTATPAVLTAADRQAPPPNDSQPADLVLFSMLPVGLLVGVIVMAEFRRRGISPRRHR